MPFPILSTLLAAVHDPLTLAPGRRLGVAGLRRGDILVQSGVRSLVSGATALGQLIKAGRDADRHVLAVHTALYVGAGMIIDSGGTPGLQRKPLAQEFPWTVYRFIASNVAELAAYVAEHHVARRRLDPAYGGYLKTTAASSIFAPSGFTPDDAAEPAHRWSGAWTEEEREADRTRVYFCSDFLVDCYAQAALAAPRSPVPIPLHRAGTPPSVLHRHLDESQIWRRVGVFDVRDGRA